MPSTPTTGPLLTVRGMAHTVATTHSTRLLQVLKNVELEGALLRAELSLHQRAEASKALEVRAERLQAELQQSRLASSRAVKQFEKRTTDGGCGYWVKVRGVVKGVVCESQSVHDCTYQVRCTHRHTDTPLPALQPTRSLLR